MSREVIMESVSSTAPPSLAAAHNLERLNLESVQDLVVSISDYIHEFLVNSEAKKSMKEKCFSILEIQKQHYFKFSEQSVLSNFYCGITNIEAAIQAVNPEDKDFRLKKSEQLLQVPALLDEQGITAGIPNRYLVCFSFFYLSIVGKLRKDHWQVALHFLQAFLVSPELVATEFASEICERVFSSRIGSRSMKPCKRVHNFGKDDISETIKQMARRYKYWIIYYQVMLYGRSPQRQGRCIDCPSPDIDLESCIITENFNDPQKPQNLASVQNSECDCSCAESPDSIENARSLLEFCNENMEGHRSIMETTILSKEAAQDGTYDQLGSQSQSQSLRKKTQDQCNTSENIWKSVTSTRCCQYLAHQESSEANHTNIFSNRYPVSLSSIRLSHINSGDKISYTFFHHQEQESSKQGNPQPHLLCISDSTTCTTLQNCTLKQMDSQKNGARRKQKLPDRMYFDESYPGKDCNNELLAILEKVLSKFCLSQGSEKLGNSEEDYAVEVSSVYHMLNSKRGVKYVLLKDVILEQLLGAISSSREEHILRESISILLDIVSKNRSVIEDIKKKGLQLCDLAGALKRNVHEAAILIHLINPSPSEIRSLELLPTLVEVVCTFKSHNPRPASLFLTPPAASLMIIEILITAFDYATNNMHLAAINSPSMLCRLLDVPRTNNEGEIICLARILVKCMKSGGQCRKYIWKSTPVSSFISLLQSHKQNAKLIALEYFHEILQIPRSSAISLLQQVKSEGSINFMHMLMLCAQQLKSEHQLMAANLLLQIDTLENSSGKSVFLEEALQVLLKALASGKSPYTQILSASILSNICGTYSWTGESYTVPWLIKKAGLSSLYHRNMIKNIDWFDNSLQDEGLDSWSSKVARRVINSGSSIFHALEEGLKSNIKRVARDSLTAITWLACETAKGQNGSRHLASNALPNGIENFLHPGFELEERLLACLCIYSFASGQGMQRLINFSEGVRESLRRFSSITWIAEELHKVADYCLPNKSRISCVHTQILEARYNNSGAVTALIYYKGLLYSGYANGSIKVWDIKKQSAILVWDTKEHKKAVTCFALYEPGDSLLSGSADKTIRVWQMVHRKLECIEVIATKKQVQKLETYGQNILAITESCGVKIFNSSRRVKAVYKGKRAKCIRVFQGKAYIGCRDSSIQELNMTNNREREIKAPTRSWLLRTKSINSLDIYKSWLYCGSSIVEGSHIKDWKNHCEPRISIAEERRIKVIAMEVVEDFIYLNCSTSASIIQIWLRSTGQKVGRLSAGSRITSLLTANDIVLCGTEAGLIKGWIPL